MDFENIRQTIQNKKDIIVIIYGPSWKTFPLIDLVRQDTYIYNYDEHEVSTQRGESREINWTELSSILETSFNITIVASHMPILKNLPNKQKHNVYLYPIH